MAWYVFWPVVFLGVPLAVYGGWRLWVDLRRRRRFFIVQRALLEQEDAVLRVLAERTGVTADELRRRLAIEGRPARLLGSRLRPEPTGKALTEYVNRLFRDGRELFLVTDSPAGIVWTSADETEIRLPIRDASGVLRNFRRVPGAQPPPDLMELTENEHTGAAVRRLADGFDDLFRALGPPPAGLTRERGIPVSDGGGGTKR